MAGTDLYLRILISAQDSASGVIGTVAGGLSGIVSGPFKQLANGMGNLSFGLRNLGTAGTIGMDALSQGAVQAGNALWKIATTVGLVAAVVAIAIGVIAVRAAGDYQSALTRLYTTAGETQANLSMVGQGMLTMSTEVGTGAQTLAQAMYFVESGGFHGKAGLDVLRIAAMGAKAENSDLNLVVKTLVSTLNAYTGTGLTTAGAMNTLIAAVSQGHMTLNDLAGAVSNVLPATARFHISLIDTTGAIAEMTKQGDNASSAATHLRQMILALESPSKIGAAAMKSVGLSAQQISDEMKKSLPGAIQMVTDAVGKKFPEGSAAYNKAIRDIAGGSRQMMGFLELSGTHAKDFAAIVKTMAGDVKAGGSSIMGWAAVQGNFNFKLDQAKAAGQALLITIGQGLLPALTNIVAAVVPIITGFTQWVVQSHAVENVVRVVGTAFMVLGTIVGGIVHFFQSNEVAMDALKATLILVAIVVGVVLVAAFVAAAVAVWGFTIALLANPITWIVIAIIAVITGIILVITHWGQIMSWLGGIFSWLGSLAHAVFSAMGAFIGGVFSAIGTFIHDKLVWIQQTVGGIFDAIGSKIHAVLSGIGSFVGGVFSAIGTFIHDKLTAAATFVYQKVQDIQNFFKQLPGKILSALATLGGILLAPFKWFYDHNYYVKAAVDAIKLDLTNLKNLIGSIFSAIGTTIQNFLTWLKNNVGVAFDWVGTHVHDVLTATKNVVGAIFSAIGTFIHDKLVWIQQTVGSIFSAIGTFISDKLTWIKNLVGTIFSAIGTFIHDKLTAAKNDAGSIFSTMGSLVSQKVTDLKNAVGNIFSQLGTLMHQKLVDAWNSLVSFASGWPSKAAQWGIDLIQGLIGGIGQKLQDLKNMMGNVAGAIGNFLGFHSSVFGVPPEGAGKDADKWMPALVKGLTGGLLAGIPQMQSALGALVAPVKSTLTGVTPGPSTLPQRSTASAPIQSRGPVTVNLTVTTQQLDPREADRLIAYMADKLRAQLGNV
jgi:TP901 family phage tail tape measure protein